MSKQKDVVRWQIPVPKVLDDAVTKAIQLDMHSTRSDFVRDAVREKLAKMGYEDKPFEVAVQ
jgi:Arc/MetJ-type ribon-helix-helix transcriptional regulator